MFAVKGNLTLTLLLSKPFRSKQTAVSWLLIRSLLYLKRQAMYV
jgi:hypothetical protein